MAQYSKSLYLCASSPTAVGLPFTFRSRMASASLESLMVTVVGVVPPGVAVRRWNGAIIVEGGVEIIVGRDVVKTCRRDQWMRQ